MNISRFSNINALGIEFGLAIKKDQGQPRFIICANLVGPTSPMLYTKSQGHWPFGRYLKVFTLYGHGRHLGGVTITIWFKFTPLNLRSLHMKFEFNWHSDF